MLTRDDILNVQDTTIREIIVPEWSETEPVCVRVMTSFDRDSFEAELFDRATGKPRANVDGFRARLCVRCICDDMGERAFKNDEWRLLADKAAPAIERIFPFAQELNQLTAKAMERLAGNSSEGPKEDS